jgi:hypothetical protein
MSYRFPNVGPHSVSMTSSLRKSVSCARGSSGLSRVAYGHRMGSWVLFHEGSK